MAQRAFSLLFRQRANFEFRAFSSRFLGTKQLQNQTRSIHTTKFLHEQPKPNKPKISTKGITWGALGIFLAASAGVLYYYEDEKKKSELLQRERLQQKESMGVGKPNIGGPFSLVDQDGVRRTEKDFLGKFPLVYFGFTFCPDICPIELTKLGDALRALESSPETKDLVNLIQPIFISVDPKRDSLKAIKEYTQEFHPRLLGMTGTKEEITQVTKSYRVYYSALDDEGTDDYLVDHSIFIYLMGPNGQLVDYYGQNRTTQEMTESLAQYLKNYKNQQ